MDQIRISPYVIPGIRLMDMQFTPAKFNDAAKCLTDLYKLRQGSLLDQTRKMEVVYVRYLLIYFCRKELKGGVVEVGNCLKRDHTTVTYATGQFQDRLDTDSQLPIKLKTLYDFTRSDYSNTRKLILQAL